MRALVVTTAANRLRLAKLIAWLNARDEYPKDGVNVGGGTHAPAAMGRTLGYQARVHPTRTGERALVLEKPKLRRAWQWVKERIAERRAEGTADADDLAIDAWAEVELPDDWTPAEAISR